MGNKEELDAGLCECIECETCMEEGVCPTYKGDKDLSPLGRILILRSLVRGDGEISDERYLKSLLSCTGCGRCKEVCPQNVETGDLVRIGREILFEKGILPLDRQKKIIDSIENFGNAVTRPRDERIAWVRQEFKEFLEKRSENLLFLGCLSSYLIKDAAKSSVDILKRYNFDFFILEDEGCCGIYLYDGGFYEKARSLFSKNAQRFKELGIKKIVTLCASCYKCLSLYYEKVLGKLPFSVVHIVEVLDEIVKEKTTERGQENFILHDPCKMSRFLKVVDEPRSVLKKFSINFSEFSENRENSFCCGAGSGVRSIYPEISQNIAEEVWHKTSSKNIVTLCPFCVFNFNYTARKRKIEKKAFFITEVL